MEEKGGGGAEGGAKGGGGGGGGGGSVVSMHLSGRGELGQELVIGGWPKGLSRPSLPLLPRKMEVGWIRLQGHAERRGPPQNRPRPGQRRKENHAKQNDKAKYERILTHRTTN